MKIIREREALNKIDNELIDLNLRLEGRAFMFWRYVLLYVYKNEMELFSMQDIYTKVATHFKTTESRAERVLREGRDMMKKSLIKKYNINQKITNGTIIRLFQIKIF